MNARRLTLMMLVLLCALTGVLAFGVGSAGALVSQFGSQGEGAGQFESARGVAVDQASGDVYLVDSGNNRVDQFTAEGTFVRAWGWGVADGVTQAPQTCTTTCFKGTRGSGAGQFGSESKGMAVDNDQLSSSYQDVYVSEHGNHRVEKFSPSGSFILMFGKEVNENGSNICLASEKCQAGKEGTGDGEFNQMEGAIAVGPTGDVFVGDHERVQEFSPEGVFVSSFALEEGYPVSLAVNGVGDMYVASYIPYSLHEYNATGTLIRALDTGGRPEALTIDGSEDLFVEDFLEQVHHMLEYGPGGEQLASYDTGTFKGTSLAFSENLGVLYVLEREDVRLLSPPVPGPELVGNGSPSGVEPTSVTLNETVNPEGNATSYRFEYGPSSAYSASVPVPEGSLPATFTEGPASATLTKLTPDTTYHYRIVASDSKGHVTTGPDETFTTRPAVSIDSMSTTNVAATSATLEAQLNPLGADATYRLEYDTSEYTPGGSFHGTTAIEGSLRAGPSDVPISVHVDGLQLDTLYHFRVVALDTREGISYTVYGPDETFTTQGVNTGQTLPDGRQWEMVSSPEKEGTQILAIGQYSGEGAVIEAAASGGAVTYMTAAPTEPNSQGYANYEQVFSARGPSGWSSRDISLPHKGAAGVAIGVGEEYRFFTEDLSLAAIQPFGSFTQSLSDEASEQTPFVHNDYLNGDATDPCVDSCYRPVVSGAPGHADVPPGAKFGDDSACSGGLNVLCGPDFVGATPDLSHVLFSSTVALTTTPIPGESLYEWSDGSLELVSVLPNGEAAGGNLSVGQSGDSALHAISNDGSRIIWTDEKHLYMRDTRLGKTVELDTVRGGSGEDAGTLKFQMASADDSQVFFTDTQRLTANSGGVGGQGTIRPDLYECEMVDIPAGLECHLSDLTPPTDGEPANVQRVIGASEDASWLYYVAGTTLYMRHDGFVKTVAVLSSVDEPDWEGELSHRTSRVSPDGQWLTFMSQRELTGYKTQDAVTGEPDEEVYLYEAEANGGAGKLVCASCDPTGARPVGVLDPEDGLTLGDRIWSNVSRVAANIPGWTPYWLEGSLYQSRYLSDSGRLFFNSNDGLVPQDVNGTEDVYEFEPPGIGGCSITSVLFSARSGGCVGLISAGGSGEESGFLDATATGSEVFFLTSLRLSSADRDSSIDLYDARECSAGSPCFAQPPTVPPPCDTGDSCKSAPSPQPAVFGAPASATFAGAGNVTPTKAKASVKTSALTRGQKLARALKVCGKEKRGKRTACRRQAKAKYAVKRSSRASAIGKGGR
jgi:hypothetical protein